MTYLLIGTAQLVAASLLLWLGRPRNGRSAQFLERTGTHVPYTVAFTALFGFGLALSLAGLAGLT